MYTIIIYKTFLAHAPLTLVVHEYVREVVGNALEKYPCVDLHRGDLIAAAVLGVLLRHGVLHLHAGISRPAAGEP